MLVPLLLFFPQKSLPLFVLRSALRLLTICGKGSMASGTTDAAACAAFAASAVIRVLACSVRCLELSIAALVDTADFPAAAAAAPFAFVMWPGDA